MARRPAKPQPKPSFELAEWYSSETAKRRLGAICQAINEQGEKVALMGTEQRPLLLLEDADNSEPSQDEVEITIDEAKADWSSVIAAAMFMGTRFRIHGKKVQRAVLYRHPKNSHPALKYQRAQSLELKGIAQKLEDLLDEVRQLGRAIDLSSEGPMGVLVSKLERASDVFDRRFREVWRNSQNLPAQQNFIAAH